MARYNGTFKTTANYEPQIAAPFDARALVEKKADLFLTDTWQQKNGDQWTYPGMVVSVAFDSVDNNGVYVLLAQDFTQEENWKKLSTLNEIADLQEQINNLVIGVVKPLTPVSNAIIIKDNTIDVGVSNIEGNALVKKEDGLYVGAIASNEYGAGEGLELQDNIFSVKLAAETYGLVAVNGELSLVLATETRDGAMSQEDKVFINKLKDLDNSGFVTQDQLKKMQQTIEQIEQAQSWGTF